MCLIILRENGLLLNLSKTRNAIGPKFCTVTPLTPDRRQVERPPPSLQITSNFLVFYGLSHGTTLEKNGVAQNLIYSKI